ncbi:mitochondrial outer membrane translocase complex, subunit Tom20 domain-containing protein [Pilobolus umbonatus]|nr:mitochondrial outer membrane translocase complex, subunit Tom20 domain-containing protein [Pilobolus umbonatus]
MKTSTISLITAGVLATSAVGYILYFDFQRRNNPNFRKQLRRERKMAELAKKEAEENSKKSSLQLIEKVIHESTEEQYPTSPADKEKYFLEQIGKGEQLCLQGPSAYDDAVLPFYKAIKVYPAPEELLTIYEKTIPGPVFETIIKILTIEQKAKMGEHNDTPEAAAASATGVDVDVE